MDCVFCRIIAGELPAFMVHQDEWTVSFLDINPVNRGHCLVVPRRHVEFLDELQDDLAAILMARVSRISSAAVRAMGAAGFNIFINNGLAAGQIVPHLHFHVLPRFRGDGLRFEARRRNLSSDEMREIGSAIAGMVSLV